MKKSCYLALFVPLFVFRIAKVISECLINGCRPLYAVAQISLYVKDQVGVTGFKTSINRSISSHHKLYTTENCNNVTSETFVLAPSSYGINGTARLNWKISKNI